MIKKGITLYCKTEKWLLFFKSKEELIKKYSKEELKNIGKNYKELRNIYSINFDSFKGCFVKKKIKSEYIYFNYILRDFNGNPIILEDLQNDIKKRRLNIEEKVIKKGIPIKGTGLSKRNKKRKNIFRKYDKKPFGRMKKESFIEIEEGFENLLKKRLKRKSNIRLNSFIRNDLYFYEIKEKNWKKYRKKQWK